MDTAAWREIEHRLISDSEGEAHKIDVGLSNGHSFRGAAYRLVHDRLLALMVDDQETVYAHLGCVVWAQLHREK